MRWWRGVRERKSNRELLIEVLETMGRIERAVVLANSRAADLDWQLKKIQKRLETLMTREEFYTKLDAETNRIADLVASLKVDDPADVARRNQIVASLQAIGANPVEPLPGEGTVEG